MKLEEEPKKLLSNNDHYSEDESKDELSSERNQSPPSSPPLLDFPPVLTLPPTPPLPSSPTDFELEEQDSENDGPPPGWDNSYQLNEQTEQLSTLAVFSSDIKTDDVKQDVCDEDGPQPRLHAHPCSAPELVLTEQDSEDEGSPPGWDNKSQLKEQMERLVTPAIISKISSNLNLEEQDSEDEGPPPGWDNSHQLKEQAEHKSAYSSDIKMEDVRQDARNKEGRPPSQAQELVSSEREKTYIKVEQQNSEDEGPPPGWDFKFQPEPERHTTCSTTPKSDIKTEDIQQNVRNEDGPQPHSQAHPSSAPEPAPSVQKDVKIVEEIFQPPTRQHSLPPTPTRQHSLPPTKRQISVPKPPTAIDYPEMGQMVCGSCRHLLSYPKGARYVECACCLEENYVLEEHEVGQVICGGCNVLLMYPYGAPKVRCANCSIETEIGDQNRRPTLSEHQSRARRHLKRVHVG